MEVVSGERSTGEGTKAMVAGSVEVAAWSGGERKINVPSCFVQSASDFNTETVKARLSKFSQADGHLPKGTFVVCKADLFRDDCALWRVDNQNMIQKYPPRIDPATRDISYRNSSTYSGWCDQVAFGYYRIAIKHLKQTRSEAIIQPEIPITDLFPAMSFEYKDASGSVRGEELVVSHLLKTFGSCDEERAPTRKEQKLIDSFSSILRNATHEDLDIECEEDCVIEDEEADPLWEPDDEEETASTSKGPLMFGNVEVSKEQVESAIRFYRSSAKGCRSLSCMSSNFRFIRSEYHLMRLRQIEREGEILECRLAALRTLADDLKEKVKLKLERGVTLHDCDIRQMALKINRERSLLANFKAGHRKSFLDKDRISADARNFVSEVKKVSSQMATSTWDPSLVSLFSTSEETPNQRVVVFGRFIQDLPVLSGQDVIQNIPVVYNMLRALRATLRDLFQLVTESDLSTKKSMIGTTAKR
ncbi:unnamed protein product [Haemonchus placei]|uniref:Mitochondria-eating protein n=1 Tax=Haemonchus placei TaxID=6290 RepID=A0A0N4WJI1_HAEPC|nr:unnamed protein product [Haemonchus placei]